MNNYEIPPAMFHYHVQVKILKLLAKENHDLLEADLKLLGLDS